MKRKLIKQANQAYTITLPVSWVRQNKFDAGDEVDIHQEENVLVIAGKETTKIGKTTVDCKGLSKREKYMYLNTTYAYGFDEVVVLNSPRFGTETMLGYAVLEEKPNYALVKDISGVGSENLDEIFKRTFQILIAYYGRALEDILGEQAAPLKEILERDQEVNKFSLFLQRAVMKQSLSPTEGKIMFAYAFILEQIGDEMNRLWRNQKPSYKHLAELGTISKQTLEKAFTIYYQESPERVKEIHALKQKARDVFENNLKKENAEGAMRMIKIVELSCDLTPLAIMKKMKAD